MSSIIDQLLERWRALQQREQQLVALAAAVVAVTLVFLLIIEPTMTAHARAQERLSDSRDLAVQLEMAATRRGAAVGASSGAVRSANRSLIAVVDQTLKSSQVGKAAARLQPEGDTKARVWLEDVNFDATAKWLHDLQTRYGIDVLAADIARTSGSGLVDVRLTLERV